MTRIEFSNFDYNNRCDILKRLRLSLGPVGDQWQFYIVKNCMTVEVKNTPDSAALTWMLLTYGNKIKVST